MRVKSFEKFIDRAFWGILLIAPVIAFLIASENNSAITLISILEQFNVNSSNIVYTTLVQLFGNGGVLAFLDTSSVNVLLLYMSYLVIIELIHIVIDVLIFIPRIIVRILDRAVEMGDTKKWKD